MDSNSVHIPATREIGRGTPPALPPPGNLSVIPRVEL
jgi:hypothetical protein